MEHDDDNTIDDDTNREEADADDEVWIPPNALDVRPHDVEETATYCFRHHEHMEEFDPLVRYQGAVYTTIEDASAYTCPLCVMELAELVEGKPRGVVFEELIWGLFHDWDQGRTERHWFRYLDEAPEEFGEADVQVRTDDEGGESE